jgi:hypothetical protein
LTLLYGVCAKGGAQGVYWSKKTQFNRTLIYDDFDDKVRNFFEPKAGLETVLN